MSVVTVSLVRAVRAVCPVVRGAELVVGGVETGLALLTPHAVLAGEAGAELLSLVLPCLAVRPAVTELRHCHTATALSTPQPPGSLLARHQLPGDSRQ